MSRKRKKRSNKESTPEQKVEIKISHREETELDYELIVSNNIRYIKYIERLVTMIKPNLSNNEMEFISNIKKELLIH